MAAPFRMVAAVSGLRHLVTIPISAIHRLGGLTRPSPGKPVPGLNEEVLEAGTGDRRRRWFARASLSARPWLTNAPSAGYPAAPMTKIDLLQATPDELKQTLVELGHPAFRAQQIHAWFWKRNECDPERFTDLPAALRTGLADVLTTSLPEIVASQSSPDGRTHKLALRYADAAVVEAVLMLNPKRRPTLCISSQTGCGQGCAFCSTAQLRGCRNLSFTEIVAQVWLLRRFAMRELGETLEGHNLVYMGMGEPLANYESVRRSIEWLVSPETFDLSPRAITISTVGIPEKIRQLARARLGVSLAISLNAATDEARLVLMPRQDRRPIRKILEAARYFFETSRRRVTFEYVLVDGVNSSRNAMRRLAELLRGMPARVNLIPLNPGPGIRFRPPSEEQCKLLVQELQGLRIQATLRHSQGGEIQAACGQLAPKIDAKGRMRDVEGRKREGWARAKPKTRRRRTAGAPRKS